MPKPVTVPTTTVPKFPDFVAPEVPASFTGGPVAANQDRAWRLLQAGDLKNAEREFVTVLKASPSFFPAETGLGYVALARQDGKAALPHFDQVLSGHGQDVSALVGRGHTLLSLGREADALTAFEAALGVNPGLTEIERRVEVLRFRGQQEALNEARTAAAAGRLEDAASRYARAIEASPESPFLYRELAGVENRMSLPDRALEHYRRAVELDAEDARSMAEIGRILESREDFDGAAKSYSEALALGPDSEIEARLDAVRSRIELAKMPEQYRAIDQAPQITRADLAALIGVRLGPLLQSAGGRDAVLITDIRTSWAAAWILTVARAGIMEPFVNHAFQPDAPVTRVDLAQAVARLLTRVADETPSRPHPWESAKLAFSDLAAGHLAYPAASAAAASGVMKLGPDNAFQPSAAVSGQEAIDVIGRVDTLARGSAVVGNGVR